MLQDRPAKSEITPLSPGEYMHWLEEVLLVSEWLDGLCLAAAEMDAGRWWRLGGRLGLARAGVHGPLRHVAAWRDEALSLQRDLLGRLEAGMLDQHAAQTGLARLAEMVPAMHREILRAVGSVWWRMGVSFRPDGRRPVEEAAAVMARFRRWKAQPEIAPAGESLPPHDTPPPMAWQNARFHQLVHPLSDQGEWPAFGASFRISERRLAAELSGPPFPEPPLVTVILAVRDCAESVAETVRGVMDQTWRHWELIVCDDGSRDGTADAACAAGDVRVRALRLVHSGLASARNRGLMEAGGRYIAYLEPDCLWHPAYLERMVCALERQPGRWCAYARMVETGDAADGTLRLHSAHAQAFSHDRLAGRNFIRLSAFFHRVELYRLFGGFAESLPQHQDWDLMLKYTFAQHPVHVDRYLALHRRARRETAAQSRALRESEEAAAAGVAANVRSHYAGGLAGPGRGARRRVAVVSCEARPDDVRRARQLGAALRAAGFDVHDYPVPVPAPGRTWNAREQLAEVTGGMVVCVGAFPYTLELGLAAAAEHGEGFVLDLTAADLDEPGGLAPAARLIPFWTTGDPRVDRKLGGRAMFLGGYEGVGIAACGPAARRVLWSGRPSATARPTPAELALRADLPLEAITDAPADRWGAALFWPVIFPAPAYSLDPFVLARAFALGIPVILGDPAGPDELVRQDAARWVNPEDDEALREAIDEALEGRGAVCERTAVARRLFDRQYGMRAAAAQFSVVWERAMAEAAKSGPAKPRMPARTPGRTGK